MAQSVAIDIGEVVKSLHILATNPALRHQFGETGRKRAEELYSWRAVIKRYVNLWDECRERFDEMGTYDFHKGDYENLLYPSYFKRFSHYATKILVSEDRLTLSGVDSGAISYKNVIKDLLMQPCFEYIRGFLCGDVFWMMRKLQVQFRYSHQKTQKK